MVENNGGEGLMPAREIPDNERGRIVTFKIPLARAIASRLDDGGDIRLKETEGDIAGAEELRLSLRHRLFDKFNQALHITGSKPTRKILMSQVEHDIIIDRLRAGMSDMSGLGSVYQQTLIKDTQRAFRKGRQSDIGVTDRVRDFFRRK